MNRPLAATLGIIFWAAVLAVLLWPALQAEESTPCNSNAIGFGRDIDLTLDRYTQVPLPAGWSWTQSPAGEHVVLGLAASTDPCAVDDIVDIRSDGFSVGSVETQVLGPDDAFIEVRAVYMPSISDQPTPRFGRGITMEDLHPRQELWDVPIYNATRGSRDSYATYRVSVWIGPDASAEDRTGAERILAGLRLR